MRAHWARAIKNPIEIREGKELVVALIDHWIEINLMFMPFNKNKC